MVPTMEKFDNPDDDTVPQTYTALRQRMDRELDRRRREQNESHQLAAPPGGYWPDNGSWAASGKGKGDGKFTHVKGKGKKPLCAAAITGTCPKAGKDCVGSHNTKLINDIRSKRGLPPLQPKAPTTPQVVDGFPVPPGYALTKVGGKNGTKGPG